MLVWGGWDGLSEFNTGGRYDPVTDTWTETALTAAPTERCPTGAIVWLDRDEGPVKGHAARKVVRTGKIHEAPS